MAAQYFAERPASARDPIDVDVNVRGVGFTLTTDRGVFSHGHLDAGTSLLLHTAPDPPANGVFCDVGCGAGPFAIALGLLRPTATVWAVDINERARELTTSNARRAAAGNITVVAPPEVPDDLECDLIWSNPPVRIGKAAMRDLLASWLDRLSPTGMAVLVINRHLGADSMQRWLEDRGHGCDRLASRRGFRILSVSPR